MLLRARSISSKLNKAQEEVKLNMGTSSSTLPHAPSLFSGTASAVQAAAAEVVHSVKATVEDIDIENPGLTAPAPSSAGFTPGRAAAAAPGTHKKPSPPSVYGKND